MGSRRAARSLALLALLGTALAQAAPLAHRESLPGGARLLVAERPGIPVVVLRVSLPAGSARDPAGAEGLANLTAALLTRGTDQRTGPELDRAIEFVGGSLEAGAGRDRATVGLAVLKKDLALGLDLLAEALLRPAFPEAELRRTVEDIRAGIRRAEENPETVAGRALAALLFPGHPYAHPVAGTEESLGRLTREQVLGFHRRHYRPDGAVIAAVGDVTVAEIREALLRRLGGWTAPQEPLAPVPGAPAAPPVAARTIARDLTQATVFLGRPGIRQDHPDYFPLVVANYILGGGSASRLYQRVREERGLAYAVSSGLEPLHRGASYLIALQTRLEAVDEAVRLVKEEMARMGREPVAPGELELARSYLIGSYPLRLDTSGKVAGLLTALEESGLGLDYPDRFKEGVGRVTAADVQRVAARYLDPATFSSVTVGK